MLNRKAVLTSFGVVLGLTVAATVSGQWFNPRQTMQLSFSRPVALPGVLLAEGTYTFELVDPNTPDIVQVLSTDRKKVHFMAFTEQIDRPRSLPEDRFVTLGEAVPDAAPPIIAWYPRDGHGHGHRFIYEHR